ncbi:MAG TPA: dipeptide ABC transporter ATP-binding protein [Acidimicrobiales bacterium]|nr:dipeptide ABC transporter ATP-binding protein [Acidimicrobiales bacterium]
MTTLTAAAASPGAPGTPGATGEDGAGVVPSRRSNRLWRAVAHNRKATAGVLLLGFFLLLAIFPGELAPYNGQAMEFSPALGPSAAHWLGTTSYGQDVFSQLIWGARQSLIIALAVGALSTAISVIVGVSAAYLRGVWDGALSLLTDVLLVIPIFPLIIVIAAYLHTAGTLVMIVVLGALGWSYGARQLRSQMLSLRNRDFLEAARARGERRLYIIVVEALPTMTSLIVASFLGTAVYAVLTAAGLQFVGLGDPNLQSWGTMLYWAENQEALTAGMPLWALMPGVCIALLGAALALLNYAFDEISNPALRPVRARAQRARRLTPTASPDAAGPAAAAAPPSSPPAPAVLPANGAAPNGSGTEPALLRVRGLSVAYATDDGLVQAVDGVDLDLARGEFLAIVGESGCGKSTLLFALARLLNPPALITGGSVDFKGHNMVDLTEKQLRFVRWQDLSVVMQSAMNALNPVMTIGQQMSDVCRAHTEMTSDEVTKRSREVLRLVSIDPVHLNSYPHQLSGGMRQRAMIAMALLFTPDLVIMDEPTSALDVVAQRSLMVQVKQLQRALGFAVVFVTHDMSLVSHFAERLMVMYAGQVAEIGRTGELFGSPRHPYTQGLLDAFPSIRGPKVLLTGIPGNPPDLAAPPSGCRFHPRCAWRDDDCALRSPTLLHRGEASVRCLRYEAGAGAELPGVFVPAPARAAVPTTAPAAVPATAAVPPAAPAAAPSGAPDGAAPELARALEAAGAPAKADPRGQVPTAREPLLATIGLQRQFHIGGMISRRTLHAVRGVDLVIGSQEIVALVGESGSGKSTIARMLANIYPPSSGQVVFLGAPVPRRARRRRVLAYRSKVPIVLQDPFSSINPVFRVRHGITRAMKLHRPDLGATQREAEAQRVMEAVGLVPATAMLAKFPYEMSGGQRQRVGFAQALALRPRLIIADEPVSMLDVSIRVGLLNLMAQLRAEEGVSFLYITHDIASARYVADRLLVMYAGRIVEQGPAEQVLSCPRHPYTKLLLQAAPDPRAPLDISADVELGEPPSVINPKPGCAFAPRCPLAEAKCLQQTPELAEVEASQQVACHVAQRDATGPATGPQGRPGLVASR